MKARAIFWTALLIASHAAVYLLPGHHAAAPAGAEAATAAPGTAGSAKARDRGPRRQDAGSPAGLLHELLAADLPPEDFKAAREALLLDWIKRDLRGALDLFFRPGSPAVYRKLAGDSPRIEEAMKQEMARQPEAVWAWIRSGRYGSNRVEVTEYWNTALIASGQRELVLANLPAGGPAERADALQKLCERAMPDELVKIRALLDEDIRGRNGSNGRNSFDDLVDAYAVRLVNAQDGNEAVIFSSEEDPVIRAKLCHRWVERDLRHLPASEVAARLEAVPADLLEEMLQTLCNDPAHGRMAGVVSMLEELGKHGIWDKVDDVTPIWVASKLVMQGYQSYMEPEEVYAQLAAIPNAEQREGALEQLGMELSDAGPDTLQMIATLPQGAGRDALLNGFVGEMDPLTPSSQLDAALALIGDPGLRAELEARKARLRRENFEISPPAAADSSGEPQQEALLPLRRSLYLAEGFYNLGKYSDAITHYEEALKIDPYNAAALRGIEAARRDAGAVLPPIPSR